MAVYKTEGQMKGEGLINQKIDQTLQRQQQEQEQKVPDLASASGLVTSRDRCPTETKP